MAEDLKSAGQYTVRDTINENIVVLTHLTYAFSIFSDSIAGFVIAIILFFASKEALSKDHFKYIIITNIIVLVIGFLFSFIFGFSALEIFMSAGPDILDKMAPMRVLSAFIGIILLNIWIFLRFIGGWIALFRKEPIQGHFGIRWRRK